MRWTLRSRPGSGSDWIRRAELPGRAVPGAGGSRGERFPGRLSSRTGLSAPLTLAPLKGGCRRLWGVARTGRGRDAGGRRVWKATPVTSASPAP